MALTKHQLLFDPAETDCDDVGAYLRSSDGTLLTHTTDGAVEALDVQINNTSLAVTATDLDIRDLAFATDSVDVSGSEVSLDAATLAALETITVVATDLDIRDLAFATDSVDVSGSEVSLDAATLAALETITVVATDLDIRDLSHTQDSVKIGDGTDFIAINADGSINAQTTPAGFDSCAFGAVSVTSTATDLVATELTGRVSMTIQNLGSQPIYIGCDNSVTSANGMKVPKGATADFNFGDGINVHAITASGTADIRIIEVAI